MGIFGLSTRTEVRLLSENARLQGQLQARASTVQNPSAELIKALQSIGLFGVTNDSGIAVDDQSALSISAYTRGLNLISDGMAVMKLKKYIKTDTFRNEVPDELLMNPNPWQTQYQWIKYMTTMQIARGNGLSRIVRNDLFKPIMYLPIHPKYVTTVVVDHDLFYKVNAAGHPNLVHHSDMIHFRGLCFDSLVWGINPIEMQAQTLGINLASLRSQARANKSNAKKAVITGQAGKTIVGATAKSLSADFDAALNGDANAVLIPNDVNVEWLTLTPAEAEFLKTRDYGAVDIARMLNMPASLLDVQNTGNKSSVEQDALNFYTLTLLPLATANEQELKRKTITNPNEYYKHNFNSLQRADAKTRSEVYLNLKRLGWTNNEIRALEDTSAYKDGETRYADMNQMPVEFESEYWPAKIASLMKTSNNPDGNNNNTEN